MWFTKKRSSPAPSQRRSFQPRLERLEDRCLLSGGVLDPTFGTGGVATIPIPSGIANGQAQAMAVQANGKVVVAGWADDGTAGVGSNIDFKVARVNTNGSLDTSFGGGVVTTSFNSGYQSAQDVLIQPDGKVVVAGVAFVNRQYEFALVRYTADGNLDPTFGSHGKVTTSFSKKSHDGATALALQTDGKIVVAGMTTTTIAPDQNNIGLARYTASGQLDATFGNGGLVITPYTALPGSGFAAAQDVAIDALGRIVVAGHTQDSRTTDVGHLFVARYGANGSLDAAFGSHGIATVPGLLQVGRGGIAVGSDSSIYAAWPNALVHFSTAGSLDTTFGGSSGIVTPAVATYSLAVQTTDGSVLVGGDGVARYQPNGNLDATFGSHGVVSLSVPAVDMALGPDGRLVLAGGGSNASGVTFTVERVLAAGPQVGSFTASANPVTAGSSLTLTASSITDTNPNSTITQVAFYADSNNDGVLDSGDAILGYGTQSSPGVWTYTFTLNLVPGTYTLLAQAEDSYGVFGDPFAAGLQVV